MRILVLNGSLRPNGNTKQMIKAFEEGTLGSGHQVDVVDVCQKKISGCTACEYCHTKGNGSCIRKDDMQQIYGFLKEADMLVLVSPIYYHGISSQLKCAVDRFYSATYPVKPSHLKKIAMFLSSGAPDVYGGAIYSFKGDFQEYLSLDNMGVFTSCGTVSATKLTKLREFGADLIKEDI